MTEELKYCIATWKKLVQIKYIVCDSYVFKQIFGFSAVTSWDIPRRNFLSLFHLDVYYEVLIHGIKNSAS